MKREIKLNMQHLSETVSSIQEYGDKLENLKSASTTFLNVLKNQDSVSYATLSEEWECGIIGYIDEIQGRLDLLESALSNYIEDMKGYISPESKDAMMRVDRNDIWYNIQQIAQQYEQFLTIQGDAGSSYPDYRHFAIGLSAEEELLMREQEERERERRERNYQKLVSFRQGSVNNALNYFLENIGDINAIYKNAIIPFENTDDDYASLAEFYYDMWATTGDNWTDFLRSSGDICRGLGDATVDMLDGIASLGAFAIYESLPARCYANGDIALLPDCITERALETGAAIEMLIKEPGIVVDCMGQNMMDTYEEEGLAYATGYVTLDVAVEILTTKGVRSVKGALRTTDATSDVMNTVATTERVADDILDVADGAKNAGRVAENVTDVAEESSKIQEILRNKRVSDAYPELDELEKFYDDIYEQQRNICQEYEDYLDELRKLQSESDIVPEGNADVVEEVAESALEGGLDSGLTQSQIADIVNTPKGSRPDPSTYLSQDYIDAHLAQFDDGISVIQTEWAYGRYSETNGFVGVTDDNTLFVMPKKYCDEVIAKANGDIAIIESELGFPIGYFSDGGGLVRIDVEDITGLNIRMPSGNETGANSLWIPGGKTSGGVPEAITDIIPLDRTDISRIDVD